LTSRSAASPDEWGTVGNREWAIHLLQGFKGIGPVQAAAIYDWFEGVPIRWDVDMLDLVEVPGIGVKRAEAMINALRGKSDFPK
jgi:Holliday junction resolvasome RuvABC DNA-binding subunit